jgi:hypothetical protein
MDIIQVKAVSKVIAIRKIRRTQKKIKGEYEIEGKRVREKCNLWNKG